MPVYEYYCRHCGQKFELLRPMAKAGETASCPEGHPGATRVVSLFAAFSKGSNQTPAPVGGGCACGGSACACMAP